MLKFEAFSDSSNPDAPVRGFLHRPANDSSNCLILTHGAGATCNAPLLIALADDFTSRGWTVLRCDLPFRQLRPHGPPLPKSAERDQAGLRAAVDAMLNLGANHVTLGGHSYGGRQASMLAATDPTGIDDLLLLSYPLHPPKRPDQLRTSHFPALQTPTLFVHGMRDGFGSLQEMKSALALIPAPTRLLAIAGAGHELLTKTNRATLINEIMSNLTSGSAATGATQTE